MRNRSSWNRPSVLVISEKHGTRYFDATSVDALHASALALLRERFSDDVFRYYVDPGELEKEAPRVDLSLEEAAGLPAKSPTRQLHDNQIKRRDEWRTYVDSYRRWYAAAQKAIAQEDGGLALRCLEARSSHEYEEISIEPLENFQEEPAS